MYVNFQIAYSECYVLAFFPFYASEFPPCEARVFRLMKPHILFGPSMSVDRLHIKLVLTLKLSPFLLVRRQMKFCACYSGELHR